MIKGHIWFLVEVCFSAHQTGSYWFSPWFHSTFCSTFPDIELFWLTLHHNVWLHWFVWPKRVDLWSRQPRWFQNLSLYLNAIHFPFAWSLLRDCSWFWIIGGRKLRLDCAGGCFGFTFPLGFWRISFNRFGFLFPYLCIYLGDLNWLCWMFFGIEVYVSFYRLLFLIVFTLYVGDIILVNFRYVFWCSVWVCLWQVYLSSHSHSCSNLC